MCESYVNSGDSNPSPHAYVAGILHTGPSLWLWSFVLLLIFAVHCIISLTVLWKLRGKSNSVRCLEWEEMYPSLAPSFLVAVISREGRTLSRRYEMKVSAGELGLPNRTVSPAVVFHMKPLHLQCTTETFFSYSWNSHSGLGEEPWAAVLPQWGNVLCFLQPFRDPG